MNSVDLTPMYFRFHVSLRLGEEIEHLERCFFVASDTADPFGWFGYRIESGKHIVITGACFNPAFFVAIGRMLAYTSRLWVHVPLKPKDLKTMHNFNQYLNIFPMGYKLKPVGDTIISVAIDDKQQKLNGFQDKIFDGASMFGRVIAVGPQVKHTKEGQVVMHRISPGTILKYPWGFAMVAPESTIGAYER